MSQSAGSASPRPFVAKLDEARGCRVGCISSSLAAWRFIMHRRAPNPEIQPIPSSSPSRMARATPNAITVPAGRSTFTIVNNSDRALEWEILDGVMVVEERENIVPGFSQTLQAKLKAGDLRNHLRPA